MNDTQLSNSIRALPRVNASPAFTHDVLRRVWSASAPGTLAAPAFAPGPIVWRVAAVLAMAACLVAVLQLAVVQQRQHAMTTALRLEQQKLEADLEAVKQSARDAEPVVVLENDRGTRVIMDLDAATHPPVQPYYD